MLMFSFALPLVLFREHFLPEKSCYEGGVLLRATLTPPLNLNGIYPFKS